MLVKNAIDCVEKGRGGPPVFLERVGNIHLPRRRHVGKDISTPEAVDRLFGIADKKNGRELIRIVSEEDGIQNVVLHGVCVLKFID
ncbi:MAG: hypothetical protein A4E66_01685 [Syntrophus sp. PtaB.Bin001]|nr:MAG: hypothetical protein A4E66_01685 [Syntrophus sp. PtaB.Bin001]